MAGNSISLEFAGDASKLAKASKVASDSVVDFGTSASKSSDELAKASKSSDDYLDRVGKLGAGVSGMTDAVDSAGAAVQGLADLQSSAADRAQKMERALVDVRQAQQDYNQAIRDGKQAQLDEGQAAVDLEQARLDQKTALKDYNKAVKEHGKGSDEAKQALIDLKQAGVDVGQAQEDQKQAVEDGKQSLIDAKDATLNLKDAQKEANPPDLQKWADQIGLLSPILSGLIGVIGLITAAQMAWNLVQLASPTTWIVLAVLALIAVIVVIATKTTWFQDLWKKVWGGIKDAAGAVGSWFKDTLWGKWIKGAWDAIKNKAIDVWDWMKELPGKLKGAFARVAGFISAPFRAAFNFISDAWNNTIGRLSWTVPGWIPGVGGNTISAPHLPKFHSGGTVPGPPGSEQLAILQAGEKVTSRAGTIGRGGDIVIRGDGSQVADALIEMLRLAMLTRNGDPAALGIRLAR